MDLRLPPSLVFVPLTAAFLFCAGCAGPEEAPPDPPAPFEPGEEIVVCGQRVWVGAPVVLWDDPGGYDAYSTELVGERPDTVGADDGRRYHPGRTKRRGGRVGDVLIAPGSTDAVQLASVVDLLVVHYDACGLSRTCFDVLHHQRGLSAHFLLDLDGTIYQTLDVRDQAWHAARFNPRSIGVEIANVGAYPPGDDARLSEWYAHDEDGARITLPARVGDGGLRVQGRELRPARGELVRGPAQGAEFVQYDYTPEQYDSLVRLSAALCRALPRIRPAVPRDAAGEVRTDVMSDEEADAFHGIVGHHHLSRVKRDPGPAFQWEAFLARVRARLSAPVRGG